MENEKVVTMLDFIFWLKKCRYMFGMRLGLHLDRRVCTSVLLACLKNYFVPSIIYHNVCINIAIFISYLNIVTIFRFFNFFSSCGLALKLLNIEKIANRKYKYLFLERREEKI